MTKCPFCSQTVAVGFTNCPSCGAYLGRSAQPPAASQAADDLSRQVLELIGQGRKLEAVKLLREATGASLADARRAVEELQAGEQLRGITAPARVDAASELEMLELLERGTPLAAVKLHMQRTGASLGEARAAVDALAARHGLRGTSGGCAGVFAVLLIVAVVGAIVAIAVYFGLGS